MAFRNVNIANAWCHIAASVILVQKIFLFKFLHSLCKISFYVYLALVHKKHYHYSYYAAFV